MVAGIKKKIIMNLPKTYHEWHTFIMWADRQGWWYEYDNQLWVKAGWRDRTTDELLQSFKLTK